MKSCSQTENICPYTLYLDGIQVLTEDSSMDIYAMSALMSLYFVFAVQYPKELINTLIVIERFVLGIMDHSVVPISVKRLYNCVGSVSGSSE